MILVYIYDGYLISTWCWRVQNGNNSEFNRHLLELRIYYIFYLVTWLFAKQNRLKWLLSKLYEFRIGKRSIRAVLSFSTNLTLCDSPFPFGFFLRLSHNLNDFLCSSEIAPERFNEIVRRVDSTLYLESTNFFVSSLYFYLFSFLFSYSSSRCSNFFEHFTIFLLYIYLFILNNMYKCLTLYVLYFCRNLLLLCINFLSITKFYSTSLILICLPMLWFSVSKPSRFFPFFSVISYLQLLVYYLSKYLSVLRS